jgi:hypothetical protein
MEHQTWYYPSKGIELDVVRGEGDKLVINSIKITKQCNLRTRKNIGIGSSKSDVLDAYRVL